MSWTREHGTIALPIDRGHREEISSEAANGDNLIGQARQRVATANSIHNCDRVSADNLACGR